MKNIDLDLRLMEIFCCVYEKGSISKTSECLHLSQSTISFHMHRLEKQLGIKLFYRKGKDLIPTSVAHTLYPYARRLLEVKLAAVEEIKLMLGSYGGLIKMGASPLLGTVVLGDLVSMYLRKNPQSRVELHVANSRLVVEQVHVGKLDLGFVGLKLDMEDLEYVDLWKDRVVFIANSQMEEELSLEDLPKVPFILREEGSSTRRLVEEALHSHGLCVDKLNVLMVSDSDEVILDVLKGVKAISFTSSLLLKKAVARGLKMVTVKDLRPIQRNFYMVYDRKRPHTPAVRNFIEETLLFRPQHLLEYSDTHNFFLQEEAL
ncbi:transcriptional regulator, LysR family [Thermocrinis albus DSM 14484]|uniref:Transcriptional regulator, LysR family n=1 Tax=Thermocrinis albus (strain DSM 14484 / JCM 11386 / HI 11/12) TaxID=638303 RepID=D3SM88_THEAH|nr:LysR family transcriptional regulator [Thermocrinis albus]ADC89868.1 transcriptional regulator, LysR family [Thermocrinis albus DSM 14484]